MLHQPSPEIGTAPPRRSGTLILANARLVTKSEIVKGSIRLEDGIIADMETGGNVPSQAVDCEGDYLIPGLIELHTDNLERHLSPRPNVKWQRIPAILAHDGELASAGITTVFDAVRLGLFEETSGVTKHSRYGRALVSEILNARELDLLKISHHIHLRAEICSSSLAEELQTFGPNDRVGIVSLMDHTPGQRQFADIAQYETYMRGKYGYSVEEFKAHVKDRITLGERVRTSHESAAVDAANRFGAVIASHDDTTTEHVERSMAHGIRLAEFPTTMEAARACRDRAIQIMMGAPNLVRGGSHSGNVAAQTLAEHDLLDIVSSDYVPSALLFSALKLADIWDDLPRAISTVTSAPAKAVNLTDRGRIDIGLRGDIVRLKRLEDTPIIKGVWSQGRRVG